MATISTWAIVEELIKMGGKYYDDPQVIKVVEYENAWGDKCWGLVYIGDPDPDRYERPSAFIRNPKVIWTLK